MHTAALAKLINLADDSLGAEALYATDEFFAPRERMLRPTEPILRAGTYDERGQWMDGWETRRRRTEGHDYCIVKLAYPGAIEFVDLDTRHFTGNYPPQASIEATGASEPLAAGTRWTEILPPSPLLGDDHNIFRVADDRPWRFLRLNIFPDGGIARFRAYGVVHADWAAVGADQIIDLFAIENGGRAIAANDQHYGDIRNLNRPGRGMNMGDGWETRRRREPGFDWVLLQLGHPGTIHEVEIDTAHFRGNYPARVSMNAALVRGLSDEALAASTMHWRCLLPEQPMSADAQHRFRDQLADLGSVSHVRVNLYPDGGISRIRLYGGITR